MRKRNTKGKFIVPCKLLSDSFKDNTDGYPGIELFGLCSLKDGKLTRSFAVVKSGKYKKKGIALNFCPFCGENIIDHATKKSTQTKKVGQL